VISKLSGTEGEKPTNPAEEAALMGEFIVDEGGDWSQSSQPGSLDKVHFVGINIAIS
jgi:hypothetical protein